MKQEGILSSIKSHSLYVTNVAFVQCTKALTQIFIVILYTKLDKLWKGFMRLLVESRQVIIKFSFSATSDFSLGKGLAEVCVIVHPPS